MGLTLAIDFGSTYTKAVAFDLEREELIAAVRAPSTVGTDVMDGLNTVLANLQHVTGGRSLAPEAMVACSSAAGGLRMVVAGLTGELTTQAAREAAFGAGAKVVGTYAHGLSLGDVASIELAEPDIILLTGGTDGGNSRVVLNNAEALAKSRLDVPIIVAGNKMAGHEAKACLNSAGKFAVITENVLPELNRLNIEPARSAIRDLFIQRITLAKGLDKARELIGSDIIPTPLAVLRGAALLAGGAGEEQGLGELIIIDVGGATTDVSSIAKGHPSGGNFIFKGLPEPYEKRTVEGDLGIRHNARSILNEAGHEEILAKILQGEGVSPQNFDLDAAVQYLTAHPDAVPQNDEQFLIDMGLASAAVNLATGRHAGKVTEVFLPTGPVKFQYGKDLTGVKTVIGTGGIFAFGREPRRILEAACFDLNNPESLRPTAPDFYVDESYIFFAVGLLGEISPKAALRILKKHLKRL